MQGMLNKVNNYFTPTQRTPQIVSQPAMEPISESLDVISAQNEIDRAITVFEDGCTERAIEIFENLHEEAIKNGNESDISIIKDKLFETAIEFLINGFREMGMRLLTIAQKSPNPENQCDSRVSAHNVADKCLNFVRYLNFSFTQRVLSDFVIVIEQNPNFKCALYYIGKIYMGACDSKLIDAEKAKIYFNLAAEQGYVSRRIVQNDRVFGDYCLMKEAQESSASDFSIMPLDVLQHITRLRIMANNA